MYKLHDQGVTFFVFDNGTLHLGLETFDDKSQSYVASSLTFLGVEGFTIDGISASTATAVYVDGEVIHYSADNGHAQLIIQWNDFKNKAHVTKSYTFKFSQVK